MKEKIRKKLVEEFNTEKTQNFEDDKTFELNKGIFNELVSIAKGIPLSHVHKMTDSQKEIAVIDFVEKHFDPDENYS